MDNRPLRVRLVFLSAALALAAMLLTGCGGRDDRAKVEASLQHYLSTPYPQACLNSRFCQEESVFPLGAGAPQVKENSCKKTHNLAVRAGRTFRVSQRGFQRDSRIGRASSGSGRPHCL